MSDPVDTTHECSGCGATLWVRDPALPDVSGTLPQVRPGEDCPYCGTPVDRATPGGSGGSVPQNRRINGGEN